MCSLKSLQICVLLAFLNSSLLCAQQKYEVESRLSIAEVPEHALSFIDSLSIKRKVKWYLEEGLYRKSIEAKYRSEGKRYSIEFDTLGNIEDVEININSTDIDKKALQSITDYLDKEFDDHKTIKAQVHYEGDRGILLATLLCHQPVPVIHPKYELVVRCKQDKKANLYEFLFDKDGSLVSKVQIVLKPSVHLEY